MARMIPAQINGSVESSAERRIFELLAAWVLGELLPSFRRLSWNWEQPDNLLVHDQKRAVTFTRRSVRKEQETNGLTAERQGPDGAGNHRPIGDGGDHHSRALSNRDGGELIDNTGRVTRGGLFWVTGSSFRDRHRWLGDPAE